MRNRAPRWLTERPIAHRGLHDLAAGRPENTIAAFEAARHAGYAIECDLHLSSDGVPVVFHDETLDRLTGEAGTVGARSAAELGRIPVLGTQEPIPTLDDMLALVAGRVPLVIELKPAGTRGAGLAGTVVERLRSYDGPAALMSFEPDLVAAVAAAGPEIPRGLTAEGRLRDGLRHLRTSRRLDVQFISYNIDDLPTFGPVAARRIWGVALLCWTVRSPAQFEKAQKWADQITFEGFRP